MGRGRAVSPMPATIRVPHGRPTGVTSPSRRAAWAAGTSSRCSPTAPSRIRSFAEEPTRARHGRRDCRDRIRAARPPRVVQGDDMVTRVVNLLGVSLLVAVTATAGCAKRPAMTQASAPPPPAAAAPPVVVQETVKETIVAAPAPPPPAPTAAPATPAPTARPAPKEFGVNANVRDIFFDFDKYTIRADASKVLNENAKWLKANAGPLVLIEGHCDERGTVEYNLALGERRAKAAMNYLVGQGLQANRFTVISYGKERPFCTERNEACWSQNRRDHFLVKAQ